MEDALFRALARALLIRFPKLRDVLSEAELAKLLARAWHEVRDWANSHGKSLIQTAAAFRRSVISAIRKLLRRWDPKGFPMGAAGAAVNGAAVPTRGAIDIAGFVDDIFSRARAELSLDEREASAEG